LTDLAENYLTLSEVGVHGLYPELEGYINRRQAHLASLGFVCHEGVIAQHIGSTSYFVLTQKGLSLFNQDITEHIQNLLSNY
jgi:hypothetical protein